MFSSLVLASVSRIVQFTHDVGNDMADHDSLTDPRRSHIALPPLPEQRAIAHILGTLDDKIELNRRMNETLEAMARALFKSWFVDFDPVRAKAEGRQPARMDVETAALFPDSFIESELGLLPKGWDIKPVREIIEDLFDGPHATPAEASEGAVYLGIKNLTGTQIDLTEIRYISEPASGGALPSRPGRGSRYQRSRLADAFAPTSQRTAGRRRSAGLRSRFSPPPASGRRDTRSVVRAPVNFTARRAVLPAYRGKGRKPVRGARPPPPTHVQGPHHGGNATGPPGNLAAPSRANCPVAPRGVLGRLGLRRCAAGRADLQHALIHDPRFDEPLLLNTSLPLTGAHLQAFYRERWPVEGLPLTAKQMLGAARQFVFAPESRQRLPELALVAGAILMYSAATQPALPTGFWDRAPKPTSGRLRRLLAVVHCADLEGLPEQLRKKPSPTAHLPKGVLGHRRQQQGRAVRYDMPLAA